MQVKQINEEGDKGIEESKDSIWEEFRGEKKGGNYIILLQSQKLKEIIF